MNTQRVYLHSIITKEGLLGDRATRADTEASEWSGTYREGRILNTL